MANQSRAGEQGSARLKFLIVMAIIGVGIYIGYSYVPIAYNAYVLKDLMQHKVDVASTQGYPATWVGDQIKKSASEYGLPPDAIITPSQQDNRIQVRIQFTQPIEFPGYTYQYEFDHTARSTEFLTFK
ncbi:MAG: hypothetical protein ABJB97_09350 [Acidobacteriota bacterium]